MLFTITLSARFKKNLKNNLFNMFLDQPAGAEFDLAITLIENNLQIIIQYIFA